MNALLSLLVTEQMPDFNDNALETQLRRFLYLGKEKPEYQPGNWLVHQYYVAKNISSIDELSVNPVKHDTIISSILAVIIINFDVMNYKLAS